MFFAVDLLIPQHGGKFALAWLAATRGIGHTSKKEIVACDIAKLCDEILEMVQSSSTRPRLRLSLSLASRLINGATRIYKAQVEVFRDEVVSFLTMVRKPVINLPLSQESGDTPLTPITRPQRKRKRKTIRLSEDEARLSVPAAQDFTTIQVVVDEEELARPSAHRADVDSITLREELPILPPDQMVLDLEEEQLQTVPRVLEDAPFFQNCINKP